jgi:glycosyltransferase involved in cell wall biosynthesis
MLSFQTGDLRSGIPAIAPVPSGLPRPLFSVMIPTFQPQRYLEDTLRSVLDQDPGPGEMQIEIVDDASTNEILEATLGRLGPDRISLYRQEKNLGLSGTWTACIQRARGTLVHILHQDDVVLPGFYRAFQEVFEQEQEIGAAFCQFLIINENRNWTELSHLERGTPGILPNWLERIAVSCAIQCPAIVVKRRVYEDLGGFRTDLASDLDWEMWKRIAVRYPTGYVPKALACYRIHGERLTTRQVRSGVVTHDVRRSIAISRSYLPESLAARLTRAALDDWAQYTITRTARDLFLENEPKAARAEIWECLLCSRSPRVLFQAVRLLLWAATRKGRKGSEMTSGQATGRSKI